MKESPDHLASAIASRDKLCWCRHAHEHQLPARDQCAKPYVDHISPNPALRARFPQTLISTLSPCCASCLVLAWFFAAADLLYRLRICIGSVIIGLIRAPYPTPFDPPWRR